MQQIKSFFIITISTIIMAIGVYFFKFPNNFCFGGVTGAAVVFAKILPISASSFSFVVNMALLVVGFAFLGKSFALRTTYATILLSGLLVVFERAFPLKQPLSNEPMLELIFAIALPAIASALLFYEGSSSGGTDVIAMIVKKYAHVDDIGIALFVTDLIMIIIACFVFDIKTALYSFVGLTVKSFLIDAIIENIMLRKSIMITCDDKDAICHFITGELQKGATIVEATGAYTNEKRYLIFTTLTRKQAAVLRSFIHQNKLHAFISMSSTSEVFGKGFTSI
ncbi:MAG: YitT family protein [Lachnobacterium sp.]|nr:YitT family protein [Lachnobacterium sp.]MCI7104338.1 YitT family protein [Lachnobacterium sp.]